MRVVVSIPREGVERYFNSQKDAADYLGVDKFHIWSEINQHNGGSRTLQKRGVLVMTVADYEGLSPIRPHHTSSRSRFRGGKGQCVRMLDPDTHEILDCFDSLREAAEDMGVSYISSIVRCCKGLMKQAHGYKWEYAD